MLLVVIGRDEALHDAHAVAELQQLGALALRDCIAFKAWIFGQELWHIDINVVAVLGLHEC